MYREEHESWMMDHYGFVIFTLYYSVKISFFDF